MQKRGRNIGGYAGEQIEIQSILKEMEVAALARGWRRSHSARAALGNRQGDFYAYERLVETPRLRVYLSAGIHGDEPAGPLAALRLIRENAWPENISLWFCPCLNPTGFPGGTRTNHRGIDLNRDYRSFRTWETLVHAAWLQKQPRFDFTLCLHEDWEAAGFYIYELNLDSRPSFAPAILRAVEPVCPLDLSDQIDGWVARGGVIRPDLDPKERPEWAEAPFLAVNKTRQSYTLESPSDFPMESRVAALTLASQAAIREALRVGG